MEQYLNRISILTYGITPEAEQIEGKFLQAILRGWEYLLFAERRVHEYHNQILARFLEEQGASYTWTNDKTLAVDCFDLQVIGGGRFRLDTGRQTLELWDNSQAYGRFDERGLEQKIAAAESPWRTFSITIA